MTTISTIREQYPNVSLKKICETTNLCYQYVLKASKLPKKDETYDPAAFNDDEVNRIVIRKQINLDDYDWETISQETVTLVPVNKAEDFAVGTKFRLRESSKLDVADGTPVELPTYTVVYTTETHVVFMADGSTQPRVMNWDTFAHQSPRIMGA